MSIVAEIVQTATKIDAEYINKKVPELKRNVETLKNEVITNVENIYVKYSHRYKANKVLLNKAIEFQQTLNASKEKAEFVLHKDLTKADKDLSCNIKELQVIEFKIKVVLNLQNILKLLDSFNKELLLSQYVKCVSIIKDVKELIQAIPENERFEAIDELTLAVIQKDLALQKDLKKNFTTNIEITQKPQKKITVLKIKKHNDEMTAVISAYYNSTGQVSQLNRLAKDLWECVFVPIVSQEMVLTEKEDNNSFVSLSLNVKNAGKKSGYKIVFENLERALQFLSKNFTYNISNNLTSLGYIGRDIRDNLSKLITKNCLRDTIPSNAEELQNYKVVIEDTKKLEKSLLDANIFTSETSSILEYASNVDVLFINKKCVECLKTAIELMKKDLHDMIEVGVPYNPEYPLGREQLTFPQCSISKNVQELLNSCEEILQNTIRASPESSGRLFTTITNILLKYQTFIPEFHKSYLTLPQQVAVFFNNCQYISYTLLQWNMKYHNQLKHVLVLCDFTAESTKFSIVGLEMFSKSVDSQIKQINEIMQGAQLDGTTIEKLKPKTEKCIRQCLRQQELLRTVWHKVLSYDVYNKNIGIIVNVLCKSIITDIVKLEDIPAKVAEDLVDAIKLILTRAPELFINPNEVSLYVPLWYKLNELSFVLNASLADINDRWADGKGPLALQLEGVELKRLIKALFQNTDRRAAVLAKIPTFSIMS